MSQHVNRIAGRVAANLHATPHSNLRTSPLQSRIMDTEKYLSRLTPVLRRYNRARNRGLHLAADRILRRAHYDLRCIFTCCKDLDVETSKALRVLNDTLPTNSWARQVDRIPTYTTLVKEIDALQEIWGDDISITKRGITLTTPDIILEDVYLGPFNIFMEWPDCLNEPELEVYAEPLDPQYAHGDPGVSHPHVRDESFCFGDMEAAVSQAYKDLRFTDLFDILYGLLHNYNPYSPYVRLENWEGTTCYSCGAYINPDNNISCGACGEVGCDNCMFYVDSGEWGCRNCTTHTTLDGFQLIDDVVSCYACTHTLHQENAMYDEDTGADYCLTCYEDLLDKREAAEEEAAEEEARIEPEQPDSPTPSESSTP